MRFCNLQQKKKEDLLDLDLQLEEKEEYQPYAWNKKNMFQWADLNRV